MIHDKLSDFLLVKVKWFWVCNFCVYLQASSDFKRMSEASEVSENQFTLHMSEVQHSEDKKFLHYSWNGQYLVNNTWRYVLSLAIKSPPTEWNLWLEFFTPSSILKYYILSVQSILESYWEEMSSLYFWIFMKFCTVNIKKAETDLNFSKVKVRNIWSRYGPCQQDIRNFNRHIWMKLGRDIRLILGELG